jgi:hypothetical protein
MTPNSRVAEPHEVVRLKGLMERLEANPEITFLDCHEVRSELGVAVLVDQMNTDPYVFVCPNSVHTFSGAPGSGTDHLRARIAATQFFEAVIEQQQVQSARRGSAQSVISSTICEDAHESSSFRAIPGRPGC